MASITFRSSAQEGLVLLLLGAQDIVQGFGNWPISSAA